MGALVLVGGLVTTAGLYCALWFWRLPIVVAVVAVFLVGNRCGNGLRGWNLRGDSLGRYFNDRVGLIDHIAGRERLCDQTRGSRWAR